MAVLIQSLSWTLLYSLVQGTVIYVILWMALKMVPQAASGARYHLSLSAFTVLFAWFAITWWNQYHLLAALDASVSVGNGQAGLPPLRGISVYQAYYIQHSYQSVLVQMLPYLSVLYIAGVALMLMRYTAGLVQLFSLKSIGISGLQDEDKALLHTLMHKLKVNAHVKAYISVKAKVPMVIGFIKPIILLPAATMAQLSTEQLETVLLHELAHIKRHDYLVNILQTAVETILFFNPFTWLISANIRREREHCCDDLVLDHTSEPLHYATALAALAATTARPPALTVAASGSPDYLFNRIKRIMEMKKHPLNYSRVAAAILIIAGITGSVAWLAPDFGEGRKATNSNKNTTETTVTTTTTTTEATTIAPAKAEHTLPVAAPAKPAPVAAPAKPAAPVAPVAPAAPVTEETILINRLSADNLVSEVNGFTVEKRLNKLFVNGTELPEATAGKYTNGLKKDYMEIKIFSFKQRLQMHPDASLQQLIMPASFQSGCVDYGTQSGKKGEGC